MDDSAEDADADNLFITIQIYTYIHIGIICFSTERQVMLFCAHLFRRD